jgi:hypothetical protein
MGRLRFGMRSLLALPLIVGLLLSLPIWSCTTCIDDCIPITIPLSIVVVDDSEGYTIQSASIMIPKPLWSKASFATLTGTDGRASIVLDTMCSDGYNTVFRVHRRVSYPSEVHVSAQGYQSKRFVLADRTEDPRYHYNAVPPPITVRLRRLPPKY